MVDQAQESMPLPVKVTKEQIAHLKRAAESEHFQNFSEWVRVVLFREAERVLGAATEPPR